MKKRFNHQKHEENISQLWESSNCYNPDKLKTTTNKSFSIIMPPPNANDPLHIGHAMFITLEDILIRYHRMLGDDTVWIPGTDHAGIETQFVFEKKLKKKKQSRFNFDRETLYQKIWDYVQDNSDVAINQMKKLGASADWSRFKFTLDKDIVSDVLKTFEKLNRDQLIYRDYRLVNYCPKCGTAFSNLEVKHVEKKSPLYYLKYGPIIVATTRPETQFGDVAVAVHPEDKRYDKYIGQTIVVKTIDKELKLKIIADEFVDPEFGTGAVKITPYHDFNDYEVWQRHKEELPKPPIAINFAGRMTQTAPKRYQGLKAHIAREKLVKDLKQQNLIEKIDQKYINKLSTCYRCKNALEPLPLPQFYIKVKPLVEKTIEALDNKKTVVYGSGHDKILRHWLENLEDWNISRQIVWGIRMPVWYDISVKNNKNINVSFINPKNKKIINGTIENLLKDYSISIIKKGLQELRAPINAKYVVSMDCPQPNKKNNWLQETDTFDTWFSSSQWPVVTLKNNKKHDFERFYPTSVMETGYDILPFWVMRMMMLGLYLTNQVPFKNVYLHGLIRDQKGQKMSKSKGNVINPLEISQQYGADALRMALVIRSSAGLDKSVGIQDFKAMRNLGNKIWNAARFIIMLREKNQKKQPAKQSKNKKFEHKLNQVVKQISQQLNKFQIGLAAETCYNEFWHWFCDQCIEESKDNKISADNILKGLTTFLKLLHPFVPFVTEAVWQELYKENLVKDKLLITSKWPQ